MSKGALKKKNLEISDSPAAASTRLDHCVHCEKEIGSDERALFVEEELGRIFCSENCIVGYFAPVIERLEGEYFERISKIEELSADERERLSYLRWSTLRNPEEIWREKTLTGDHRYTLIASYQPPGLSKIWCVCISLFLRGEPSFLFLAFVTRSSKMVDFYRKGERVESYSKVREDQRPSKLQEDLEMIRMAPDDPSAASSSGAPGGAAIQEIPVEQYPLFERECLDETLMAPDEVWITDSDSVDPIKLHHFLRMFAEDEEGNQLFWYVVVGRETDEEGQIEVIDAFPTRDQGIVDQYRRGVQHRLEEGELDTADTTVLH